MFIDIFVDDPGHRRPKSRQVRTTVCLRNVVCKTQHLLNITVVPLHRDLNRDRAAIRKCRFASGVENTRMQNGFRAIDIFDEPHNTARKGEVIFLAAPLIYQSYLDAVVEKRKLAKALGDDLVMVFDGPEYLLVRHVMNLGTTLLCIADNTQRRNFNAVLHFDETIDDGAALKIELIFLTVPADRQAQPF